MTHAEHAGPLVRPAYRLPMQLSDAPSSHSAASDSIMQIRSKHLTALVVIFLSVPSHSVLAQCCSGKVCTCPTASAEVISSRQGRWFVVESENFQVCCAESAVPAKELARHAEAVRTALGSKWLGKSPEENWNPRCQIVLHGSQRSYVSACGRGSERTVGSSLINVSEGRTISRRIDLLGGNTDFLSAALPHELTHVILRARFTFTMVPRWADEGAAILADSKAKQGRHHRDLNDALLHRTAFHAADLLTRDEYPGPDRMGAFYGQSASLAKFLIDRGSPERFVEFIENATAQGYDAALQKCYGIDNLTELDRQWRRHLHPVHSAATPTS